MRNVVTMEHEQPIIPRIELEKVILRQLKPSDRDDIFEAYADKEAMKFRRNPAPRTIEDADTMILHSLIDARAEKAIRWGIEERLSGKIIGTFVWKIENGKSESEIGYSLNKGWWNRGLMTAILPAMVSHLFENEEVTTLIAIAHRLNVASVRLLERVGFARIGEDSNGLVTFRRSR